MPPRPTSVTVEETRPGILKRISWGAVIAGVVVALVVQLILSLLGLGIGFGAIEPLQESNPFSGLGTGALVWWVISMLIALFLGGMTASRLAGVPRAFDSVLHGVLTFSVFTLISFYLLTTAIGSVISGVGSVVGKTISMAGQGIQTVAPEVAGAVKGELQQRGIDLTDLKAEARRTLRETGKPELQPENLSRQGNQAMEDVTGSAKNAAQNPQATDNEANGLIDRLFNRASNIANAADREAAVNVIMKRTGKSREEANQIVDNWIQTYNQSKQKLASAKDSVVQKARETGDVVASAMSKAAIFAFIGLILGAVAAAFGGKLGEPHERAVPVRVREERY
ncbi:MAG: hypothetical protein HF314_15295 [Ignavibacteria bacterium]|nr:hypothetical protein [Ignavibacteria bacterium]MCU7504445.1 hypothetical protein [Ignavibacteria bacterium]MCU7517464.1 hypothetical protein [Ignavibacteria bacterium]